MPIYRLLPLRTLVARLPWPVPALLAWACGWAVWALIREGGALPPLAFGAGSLAGLALALRVVGRWRQSIAAAGFPLSALVLGAASLPPWLWLLLLLPLLAAYPVRAWRDAPLFPTPARALDGLATLVGSPRRVLDAGCGLGHGLAALQRQWPRAEIHGLEWSRALAWLAARRSHFAQVQRGDMWVASWAAYDLVYLFQRPESMARAYAKAESELAPGAWLVSLEFAVTGRQPWASLQEAGRKPVWIYQPVPLQADSTTDAHCR
jgi:SAM-dependent methyltransferase